MKLYAEISKTESQDDGTIKVWGYASRRRLIRTARRLQPMP